MPPTPAPPGVAPRRHRAAFRVALVLAVLLALAGALIAYRGYRGSRGDPQDIVRAYFAALARGDASTALAYGDVPAGPRGLVTDQALRAQQQLAPIAGVVVTSTRRTGAAADVQVGYTLGFAGHPTTVAADVPLHHVDGVWRLDRSALVTRFRVDEAGQRVSIGGVSVPAGRVLVFPGAIPLRFDSPYLIGDAGNDSLTFGAPPTTPVTVGLTAVGRTAMQRAVLAALRRCLGRGGDVSCPQPDERYVPGSLRGTVVSPLVRPSVVLSGGPVGVLRLDATVSVRVGFRRLGFRDNVETGTGTRTLDVHALAAAVMPLQVRWTR